MGLNYQKYINRLKQKRQDNPEYALYKQSMQAMAEPMKAMNRSMQGQMSMAGGSIGAIGSTYLQGQSAMQNLAMQSFGQADRAGIARNDALDNQITQMEMTRDAEAEQKKNSSIKSGITIGATALGALAGTLLLPGVGTAAGAGAGAAAAGGSGAAAGAGVGAATGAIAAPTISPVIASTILPAATAATGGIEGALLGSQIGAGIGGIGSSFVGGADYNALQQSIGDTLAGISSISTLKTHRQFLDTFREKYQYMGEKDMELLITQYAMGDIPGMTATLNALQSPVADVTAVDSAPGAVVAKDSTGTDVTVTEGAEPTQETKTTETGAGKLAETPGGGTGKTYKDWQAMVNDGTMTAEVLKSRNIESYKERGYWYDAKGKKKTTKPDDYDKYYGTTAEQTPVVKPKEETNPPALTEEEIASMTDEELDEVISQARYEKPESGVSAPTADEINASVMDSNKTVSKDTFVAARKKAGASSAYDAMFDYMEKKGLAYDSPDMKKWVEGKYKAAGTYNRFKKIYKAAGGQ